MPTKQTKPARRTTDLAAEIRRELVASADEATRAKYERIVPGARVMGVRVPRLRALAVELRRKHPDVTLDEACSLLDVFAPNPVREEMLVGTFLIARFGKAVEGIPWRRLQPWIATLDNWEACDQLAANIAARVVSANPEFVDSLTRLVKSGNPWVRRFVVATAADLTHAGRGNIDVAFDVCGRLFDDPDPMVQTAIGWALREASKADPKSTLAFLERSQSRIKPRTLKEAAEKLPARDRASINNRSTPRRP